MINGDPPTFGKPSVEFFTGFLVSFYCQWCSVNKNSAPKSNCCNKYGSFESSAESWDEEESTTLYLAVPILCCSWQSNVSFVDVTGRRFLRSKQLDVPSRFPLRRLPWSLILIAQLLARPDSNDQEDLTILFLSSSRSLIIWRAKAQVGPTRRRWVGKSSAPWMDGLSVNCERGGVGASVSSPSSSSDIGRLHLGNRSFVTIII